MTVRPFMEAAADRQMLPMVCNSPWEHVWVEYGQPFVVWLPDEARSAERMVVLLVLCSRCRRTPEEATRP